MADNPIMTLKRQLAADIVGLADGMETSVAARRLGINASRLCDLRKGRVARFSIERLIRILGTVDREVRLSIVGTKAESINWFPTLRARRGLLPVEIRCLEGKRRTEERMAQTEAARLAREGEIG